MCNNTGFEDSAGGENPLDIPFDDFEGDGSIASKEAATKTKASSKHAASAVPSRSINGGDSSSGNGAGFSEFDSPLKQAEGESSQFDMEHFVRCNHAFNLPYFSQKILAQLISPFNKTLKFNILIHEAMRRSTRMM